VQAAQSSGWAVSAGIRRSEASRKRGATVSEVTTNPAPIA
jgi:hypothetical protein